MVVHATMESMITVAIVRNNLWERTVICHMILVQSMAANVKMVDSVKGKFNMVYLRKVYQKIFCVIAYSDIVATSARSMTMIANTIF